MASPLLLSSTESQIFTTTFFLLDLLIVKPDLQDTTSIGVISMNYSRHTNNHINFTTHCIIITCTLSSVSGIVSIIILHYDLGISHLLRTGPMALLPPCLLVAASYKDYFHYHSCCCCLLHTASCIDTQEEIYC